MAQAKLSVNTLRRLPQYLNYLHSLPGGTPHVSATQIAEAVGLNDVQVRKDLAAVSQGGRPRTGYETGLLVRDIEALLRLGGPVRFAIVGMGRLGSALAQYGGFSQYDLHLAAAFDTDPALAGWEIGGVVVRPADEMATHCQKNGIRVGVLTVPPAAAQTACDALAGAGVETIWNFAPAHLSIPAGVRVENMNMAASLGILSRHLQQRLDDTDEREGSSA